ncbi:MAG: hypothetical protein M5R41_13625 [Bacteroidia bacterium]|nr:hypothetical protein [Bacteroidia bacterium]
MRTPRLIESIAFLCLGVSLFFPRVSLSQPTSRSISLYGTVIEGSRIYLYPQSSDATIRNSTFDFSAASSVSLAYRLQLSSSTLLQCRGEYFSVSDHQTDAVGTPTRHGFDSFALETSLLFQLPFGGEIIRMCIGGGGGVYAAVREYSIATVQAESQRLIPTLDIHILLSLEWFLYRNLSLQGEVLFRDPQISVENAFPQDRVLNNGIEYPLQQVPFRSAVNLNGNVYLLGLCLYF